MVTPEFIDQVQEAMAASGLEGSASASTYGENDGCGGYHAMVMDYYFTVEVKDLESEQELASAAKTILEIVTRFAGTSPAPGLGNLGVTFQGGNQQCVWVYQSGAWNLGSKSTASETTCAVPTSEASQRLAKVLNALSIDLACEIPTVRTNTVQAILGCERAEGQDRYLMTVVLTLNKQGPDWQCFHGYHAFESSFGDTLTKVTVGDATVYYERERRFTWYANGTLYELFEQVIGGQDLTLPLHPREQVYARALQEGLITGEGNDCQ